MAQIQLRRVCGGVTLAAASMIAVAPITIHQISKPAPPVTHAAVQLVAGESEAFDDLYSLGLVTFLQFNGLPQLVGGSFDFTSAEGLQQYVDAASNYLLSTTDTIVGYGSAIDDLLSPLGITGVSDWLTAESDLFTPVLADDWDAVSWFAAIYPDNPELFFNPIADFDLSALYSALGAPEEAFEPLNELLSLQSSLIAGSLNEMLFEYVVPIGVAEQALAGNIDLADPATLLALSTTSSLTDFLAPVSDSINDSIQGIVESLQALDMGGLLGVLF